MPASRIRRRPSVFGDPNIQQNDTPAEKARKSCVACLQSPFLGVVATVLFWGAGLWLVAVPDTGLTELELLCAFFLGDGCGSALGVMFGLISTKAHGQKVQLTLDAKDWRTYIAGILFPLLSIAGFMFYSLTIDFADGNTVVFAPLTGLCIVPCILIGLILSKTCLTWFDVIGLVFCLSAVVAGGLGLEHDSNSTALHNDTMLGNETLSNATTASASTEEASINSSMETAVVMFVLTFITWGASWTIPSFISNHIPLFDRCFMWMCVEVPLGLLLLLVIYARDPASFSGLPFTSPFFGVLFSSHILNKLGVISYSEASRAGGTTSIQIIAPIANLYPLIPAILSIVVDGETATPLNAVAMVCAIVGPVFLVIKQPSCKKKNQIVPAPKGEPDLESGSASSKTEEDVDSGAGATPSASIPARPTRNTPPAGSIVTAVAVVGAHVQQENYHAASYVGDAERVVEDIRCDGEVEMSRVEAEEVRSF